MYTVSIGREVQFVGKRQDALKNYHTYFESVALQMSAERYECWITGEYYPVRVLDSKGRIARRPQIEGNWELWLPTPSEREDVLSRLDIMPPAGTKLVVFKMPRDKIVVWAGSGAYNADPTFETIAPAKYVRKGYHTILATSSRALVSLAWQYNATFVKRAEITIHPTSEFPPAHKEDILAYARGSWQASCVVGNCITFPRLKGRARHWWGSYQESMTNFLWRVKQAGFHVVPEFGPRGGAPRDWFIFDARQR